MDFIEYCDSKSFRKAFLSGVSWLSENKEVLNQLNVFPVPDGDTGTNMSLTLSSAAETLTGMKNARLRDLLEASAQCTLMSASGCSGVIISQLFAGFTQLNWEKSRFSAQDIALCLKSGTEKAYKAVTNPVEGTILTVIREASEEAVRRSEEHNV